MLGGRDAFASGWRSGSSPGVRPGVGLVHSAEEAAHRAIALAQESSRQKSFGVGGFLMDKRGRILAEATNAVIRNGELWDPTAHVERQLVDWHAEAFHCGLSAQPGELTIVTSLDPCAMCAGAILRSGMRVIAVAEDHEAGVHECLRPVHMPAELRRRAEQRMAFFAISGDRPQVGGTASSIFRSPIPGNLVVSAQSVLTESLSDVRREVGGPEQPTSDIWEPDAHVLNAIRPFVRDIGQGLDLPVAAMNVANKIQRNELAQTLAGDRCILVDERGNVIVGARGAGIDNGAQTSVLQLLRFYNLIRTAVKRQLHISLPHPRNCSIVKDRVSEDPATALMELGALGSFFEEPRLAQTLPAIDYLDATGVDRARRWAELLPPLYGRIGITAGLISPHS
jgi:tRNA(Arg) A34 adenosine deaminase TadA